MRRVGFHETDGPTGPWPRDIHRSIEINDAGLVFGAGTVLVHMEPFDRRLRLETERERLLALLAVTERRPVSPTILTAVEAAAKYWKSGDRALANLRLIFADLPRLADPSDVHRLRLAETLLDTGFSPRALMKELGLDPAALDLRKYDPDQPRVPAGNGRESGRWGMARAAWARHPIARILFQRQNDRTLFSRQIKQRQVDSATTKKSKNR